MSALRLGRLPDGTRDIRIVDTGAVARITHTRYAVKGELVVAQRATPLPIPATTPVRQAQMAAYKKRHTEGLCDYGLPSGPCARVKGHGSDHRSAGYLERLAHRQRTGGVAR